MGSATAQWWVGQDSGLWSFSGVERTEPWHPCDHPNMGTHNEQVKKHFLLKCCSSSRNNPKTLNPKPYNFWECEQEELVEKKRQVQRGKSKTNPNAGILRSAHKLGFRVSLSNPLVKFPTTSLMHS
jgi:hypothetical protein